MYVFLVLNFVCVLVLGDLWLGGGGTIWLASLVGVFFGNKKGDVYVWGWCCWDWGF